MLYCVLYYVYCDVYCACCGRVLTQVFHLLLPQASLHVIVVSTHLFDRSLIDTIINDNVNPIEKVERSLLVMASVVHECSPRDLVSRGQRARLGEMAPQLFLE